MRVCVCAYVCVHVEMWSRDRCDSSGSDQSHGVMKPIEVNKIQKYTNTDTHVHTHTQTRDRWKGKSGGLFWHEKAFSNVLMLPRQFTRSEHGGLRNTLHICRADACTEKPANGKL